MVFLLSASYIFWNKIPQITSETIKSLVEKVFLTIFWYRAIILGTLLVKKCDWLFSYNVIDGRHPFKYHCKSGFILPSIILVIIFESKTFLKMSLYFEFYLAMSEFYFMYFKICFNVL